MISAEQIKAARALLRLEQEELARRAGISVSTIRRLEAAGGEPVVAGATLDHVVKILQEAGVEFIHQGVSLTAKSGDADALFGRLRAIAERAAAQNPGRDWLSDADLYDDDGLPR
ncbi:MULTISPECIES: helix-turn-helix transcriptional regulator [Rhodomicrobium]|uniref:helix-turn-helix domain-containing protein n=1 Tax=Rhodomicrobium TaxID=1068 RepID=UPI000B4B65EF|nr:MULTISPECIES: helix-turn-helix transcriptional regulator [Rhodomicrobium]